MTILDHYQPTLDRILYQIPIISLDRYFELDILSQRIKSMIVIESWNLLRAFIAGTDGLRAEQTLLHFMSGCSYS